MMHAKAGQAINAAISGRYESCVELMASTRTIAGIVRNMPEQSSPFSILLIDLFILAKAP